MWESGPRVTITDGAQRLGGRPSLVRAWQHPYSFTYPCRPYLPPLTSSFSSPSSFTTPLLSPLACYSTWIMQGPSSIVATNMPRHVLFTLNSGRSPTPLSPPPPPHRWPDLWAATGLKDISDSSLCLLARSPWPLRPCRRATPVFLGSKYLHLIPEALSHPAEHKCSWFGPVLFYPIITPFLFFSFCWWRWLFQRWSSFISESAAITWDALIHQFLNYNLKSLAYGLWVSFTIFTPTWLHQSDACGLIAF